jgi:hypothetical protein
LCRGLVLTGSWRGMAAMFGFAVFVAVNSFASWHLRK